MMQSPYYIRSTHSTNALLRELIRNENIAEGFMLYTDFQTAGKGQSGNSWESEDGKNLLFSILLKPQHIQIEKIFIISKLTSVAIKEVLDTYTSDITIKWPNDIYWKDKKIAGILIENSFLAYHINTCMIGIGLNINQIKFRSNAPNPVSLKHILGKSFQRKLILDKIQRKITEFYSDMDYDLINQKYFKSQYRKNDYYSYLDVTSQQTFLAKIIEIQNDGKLVLQTKSGEFKEYYFKEVQYCND